MPPLGPGKDLALARSDERTHSTQLTPLPNHPPPAQGKQVLVDKLSLAPAVIHQKKRSKGFVMNPPVLVLVLPTRCNFILLGLFRCSEIYV